MGTTAEETIARLMRAYDVHDESTLAIRLGRDRHTLSVWRNRDQVPLLALSEASRATGFSVEWLRGDKGAPESTAMRDPEVGGAVVLSPRERVLVERYRSTDEYGRAAVELVTTTLATGGKPRVRARRGLSMPLRWGCIPCQGVACTRPWCCAMATRPGAPATL